MIVSGVMSASWTESMPPSGSGRGGLDGSGLPPVQVDQSGETDLPAPLPPPTHRVIGPQDWMPSLRGVYTLG